MDKVLRKMAETLNNLDEASLMALWDEYRDRVKNFSPSKAWEEDALILSMIQAIRWKNQLFNHHWSESSSPKSPSDIAPDTDKKTESGPGARDTSGKTAKVLDFRPIKKN
ncbi:MAG: hypothetical protein R6V39_00400 [Desulfovibrionales bacterium]